MEIKEIISKGKELAQKHGVYAALVIVIMLSAWCFLSKGQKQAAPEVAPAAVEAAPAAQEAEKK